MRFSIYVAVSVILLLLFFVSVVSLLFALADHYTSPLLLVSVASIITVVFLVFLITRGILAPLGQVRDVMEKVGEGNLRLRIARPGVKEMEELGNTLNEMIARLRESTEKILELDRIKTEFISVAAHQLRTPLGSMRWNLELLEKDTKSLSVQAQERFHEIYKSNLHVIDLVGDLLNVARIEQRRIKDEPELTSVTDIVQTAIKEIEPEAKKKALSLRLDLKGSDIPKIVIDAKRLREVIQNLLSNAVRYTKSGGRVTVELDVVNDYIKGSVADNGIGIPEKDKPRIFSKFFRSDNAVKMDTRGTGLGLFVVKSYIEEWGGRIWFESKEGQGTTFYFTLPLVQKPVLFYERL